MEPDDVAKGYNEIADVWNSQTFDRQNGIAQHQRALNFCKQRGHAIDIGCGSSGRIIDLLLENGFAVEGLDLSQRMLDLAAQRHPNVAFHQADICTWPFPHKYDFISAWDSIWHVPLSEHENVLRRIFAQLSPSGICIFTIGGTDAPEEKTDATMGPTMYYSALGIPKVLEVISAANCTCKHLEFDQPPESHVYLVIQHE